MTTKARLASVPPWENLTKYGIKTLKGTIRKFSNADHIPSINNPGVSFMVTNPSLKFFQNILVPDNLDLVWGFLAIAGIVMNISGISAIKHVIISIHNICWKDSTFRSQALIPGLNIVITLVLNMRNPLSLLKFSLGTIRGIIAFTAGRWNVLKTPRILFIEITIQKFGLPNKNDIMIMNVVAACMVSEIIIVFFLSHISLRVPAIGIIISCGINERVAEIDITMALSVSIVIHHMTAKNTTEDPMIDISCPIKNMRYEL